jgi:hypothetical protein
MREFWIGSLPPIIHMAVSSTDEYTTTLDPTLEDDEKDDPEMNETWLNLNSFAAGLLRTRTVSWEIFAVWQLRTALELDDNIDKNRLLVATEWVLLAGDRVFQLASAPITPIISIPAVERVFWHWDLLEIARSMAPGDVAGTPSDLSLPRWDIWRRRFSQKGASEAVLAMNDAASGRFIASPYAN